MKYHLHYTKSKRALYLDMTKCSLWNLGAGPELGVLTRSHGFNADRQNRDRSCSACVCCVHTHTRTLERTTSLPHRHAKLQKPEREHRRSPRPLCPHVPVHPPRVRPSWPQTCSPLPAITSQCCLDFSGPHWPLRSSLSSMSREVSSEHSSVDTPPLRPTQDKPRTFFSPLLWALGPELSAPARPRQQLRLHLPLGSA